MLRPICALLLFVSISIASAQESDTPTVVKSDALELKAVEERPAGVIILSPAKAKGDHDVPPLHPECSEQKGQDALDCTADRIKRLIREKLGEPKLDLEQWGSSVVGLDISINQFGEVKDIKVDHSGDDQLSRQVIIALYDLPKFVPATKDGAAVNSGMVVNYRYEDLYR